ncbi:hypothetical protein BJX65DRAFT_282739 [Aspergillus insuetus]
MRTESDSDSTQVLSFIYDQDPDFNKSRLDKLLDEDTPKFFMNQRSGVCTPLHYAAMSGSVDVVCFLKDKGAVSHKDPYNRTRHLVTRFTMVIMTKLYQFWEVWWARDCQGAFDVFSLDMGNRGGSW